MDFNLKIENDETIGTQYKNVSNGVVNAFTKYMKQIWKREKSPVFTLLRSLRRRFDKRE